MQLYNQLARSVGEIIIYEARPSITGQIFNLTLHFT